MCVVVSARTPELDIALATLGCPSGAPGGRAPNRREHTVLDEWRKRRLGEDGWSFGDLWAFLQQLRRIT